MRRADLRSLSLLPVAAVVVLVVVGLGGLGGCGEKIGIPEAQGLFSVAHYILEDSFAEPDARQVITVQGNLFVLAGDRLTKRTRDFGVVGEVAGLSDARALCANAADSLVFVWDQGLHRVTWYSAQSLEVRGSSDLPEVGRVVSMVTCQAGVELAAGASTFLYLADPDSGVVHRYAYYLTDELFAFGILCNSNGDGARFVHDPAGMARDSADSLLVCDLDTLRHWVIRFDAEPDLSDTSPDDTQPDPLRGRLALFDFPTCNPSPAADYVLGNAPGCDPASWVPGASDSLGYFDRPTGVAVDGLGRIYVADMGNDRIQRFTPVGHFDISFGSAHLTPAPTSVAVVDVRYDAGASAVDYGAYVFVISNGAVLRLISGEHYLRENEGPPPPQG